MDALKDEIVDAAVHEISDLQIELAMLKIKYMTLEHQHKELNKLIDDFLSIRSN